MQPADSTLGFWSWVQPSLNAFATWRALGLLVLIPAFIAWAFVERRKRAVLRFSAASQLFAQGRGVRPYVLWVLPVLRVLAFTCAVVALARPQERDSRTRDLSVEGIDIMIALDLSTSMEAADFKPQNRLHVAKEVLTEFLASRSNDRIGLVVFSGAANPFHLSCLDKVSHCADRDFDGCIWIFAMEVVKIDHINAQPLETSITRSPYILGLAVDGALHRFIWITDDSKLRGDGQVLALALDGLADQDFIFMWTIGVRSV